MLDDLEKILGHSFADRRLLETALTHTSATAMRVGSYQRLEFLGDRVLALVVANRLFERFPDEDEGALTLRLTALVRKETLVRVARMINLERYLHSASRRTLSDPGINSILADACEAVIAALYIDGGLDAARAFIWKYWEEILEEASMPQDNSKSMLQEWAQAQALPLPFYEVTGSEGPSHAPVFSVTVSIVDHGACSAEGLSKQQAEQAAAAKLFARLTGEAADRG